MSSIIVSLIETGHYESKWKGSGYGNEWVGGANSAGGVSVKFNIKNTSDKIIKYLRFSLMPYNRVNDFVGSSIPHQNNSVFIYTGPLYPDRLHKVFFENAWYNNTIVGAIIEWVEIEYMDGTKEQISGNNITVETYLGEMTPTVKTIITVAIVVIAFLALWWLAFYFDL